MHNYVENQAHLGGCSDIYFNNIFCILLEIIYHPKFGALPIIQNITCIGVVYV